MFTNEQLDQANCKDADGDIFFAAGDTAAGRADINRAKAYCNGCVIKDACLNEAITERLDGIWGGMTLQERDVHKYRPKTKRVFVLTPENKAKLIEAGKNSNNKKINESSAAMIGKLTSAVAILGTALSESDMELINLRVDNPGLSAKEIGVLMSEPLSKHAVSGRLRRILETVKEN
jgi:WhiB family redox-sensing transcriptional regulator